MTILLNTLLWKYLLRAAIVYLCVLIFFYCMQNKMMFPKPVASYDKGVYPTQLSLPSGAEIIVDLERVPKASFVVLYSYGNAEDLGRISWRRQQLHDLGLSTCGYDYPGYGQSTGSPTVQGLCESIDAVYRWLIESEGYDPQHIIIYGRSVGSGPSGYLASTQPSAGLILESALMSVQRVITPLRFLPWDDFRNINIIGDIQAPILLIHGKRDNTIPFRHGLGLAAAAGSNAEHCWLDDRGHNDIDLGDSRVHTALMHFVSRLKTIETVDNEGVQ